MSKLVKIWLLLLVCVLVHFGWGKLTAQPCPGNNPILGPVLVCPGGLAMYEVTHDTSDMNTFQWELNGGGVFVGSTTGTSVTVQWQNINSGPFTITCTETINACSFENSLEVQIADDLLRYPFNCFSELNIPFDENCEMLIEPHHLMRRGAPDCPESFTVELSLDGVKGIPNPISIAYLGKTIVAKIKHKETGTGCHTLITLKDGTPPRILCENDTVYCADSSLWNPFDTSYFRPIAIDNCADTVPVEEMGYEWVNLFENPEFSAFIVRSWSAVDNYDNKMECEDTLFLKRVIFDEIMCPPDTVISCDNPDFNPADPLTSGVPTFEGHPLYSKKSYCEVEVWYEDEIFPDCGGMYRIKRHWTLKDLREGEISSLDCIQMIHIIDTVGPFISFDTVKVTLEQHPDLEQLNPDSSYHTLHVPTLDRTCTAHGYFPRPIIEDSCTDNDSLLVSIVWPSGHIQYLNGDTTKHLEFKNLSIGKHIIEIIAYDLCHNESRDTLIVVTKDTKPPYIIADKQPVVTLAASSGITWIDASVFDEGTWDNCALNIVLARRADWYENKALVNLCNDTSRICSGVNSDSLWIANLEQDKHIDEVEAHYYKTLKWLKDDYLPCSDILWNAWTYDLIKHGSLRCRGKEYLPEKEKKFKKLLKDADCTESFEGIDSISDQDIELWDQIGGGWSDAIPFSCEDACKGEKVGIELLAIDEWCNIARLWVYVTVEDKTSPEIRYKLPDIRISCKAYNDYYRGYVDAGYFDIFGKFVQHDSLRQVDTLKDKICKYNPYKQGEHYKWEEFEVYNGVVYDNCGVDISEYQKIYFEKCGNGWIERHFTFKGICSSGKADSAVAVQKIEIYPDCPLQYYDFIWPKKDTTVYGCGLINVKTEGPKLRFEEPCREIGIGYNDLVVNLSSGDSVCLKIIRKWAVIDWCQQELPKYNNWIGNELYQYFEFEQIIYIKNAGYPVIQNCDLDTLCIGNSCDYDLDTTIEPTDDCTSPEDLITSWSLYKKEDYGYYLINNGNTTRAKADDLAAGIYKLTWSVTDHCHNRSHCVDYFTVLDCVKPTPVCISSITAKLIPVDVDKNGTMDTAIGEVWAYELNSSSYDNCQSEVTDFRIRWKGTGSIDNNGNQLPPGEKAKKLSLSCSDVGTRTAEFWVVDDWGNADFCEVVISVQPPSAGCQNEEGKLRGQIVNIKSSGIPDVQVVLDNGQSIVENIVTGKDGIYAFKTRIEAGQQLNITPEKTDDPLIGISTLDLIKISKHLLSKEPFHSAMQQKTADVNGDGYVSVGDIIVLRKLILGKIHELPTEKVWYFFNVENQPVSTITRTVDYRDLLYFTGIKMGDLTGDASSKSRSVSRKIRDFKRFTFYDRYLSADGYVEIPFYLSDCSEISGLQLSIKMDPNKIGTLEILPGQIDLTSDNVGLTYQDIRISWFTDNFNRIEPEEPLFYLKGYMKSGSLISDMITLSNQYISNEIYHNDSVYDLRLYKMEPDNYIELGQNYPNPFQQSTRIEVNTTNSGYHTFTVFDRFGKLVIREQVWLHAGKETITLQKWDLNIPGMYYYSIENEHDKQVKKLIFTD